MFFAAIPMLFTFAFVIVEWVFAKDTRLDKSSILIVSLFSVFSFFPVCLSYLSYGEESYFLAFFRYFYMIPFFFLAVFCVRNANIISSVFGVYVFFIFLSALSIFYQLIYGPIPWLPEASVRDGLVRYSSLVGSLTGYGVYFVFALPVLVFLFRNGILKFFIILVVVFAGLVSLQKAAVVNLFLLCMLFVVFEKGRLRFLILMSAPLVLCLFFVAYFYDVTYVVSTIDNVLRIGGGSKADVSVVESVADRLWELPSVLYEFHGAQGLLFGVGMVGGSGTLGFPEYPMSHNGLFDLLFIGGLGNLLAFLLLYGFCLSRVCMAMQRPSQEGLVARCCFYMLILFLVNFLFAGVLYFHPYGAVIFYSIIALYCFRYGVRGDNFREA